MRGFLLFGILALLTPGVARAESLVFEIPYERVHVSGDPHECLTSAPSFFGEHVAYRVLVRGPDSHAIQARQGPLSRDLDERPFGELARDAWRHNAVVLEGKAYVWWRSSDKPPVTFDPRKVTEASDALYGQATRWKDLFTLVEPGAGDLCRAVGGGEIAVPDDLEFIDVTELAAVQNRLALAERRARLGGLPFAVYLPEEITDGLPGVRANLSDKEQGILKKEHESFFVEYRREDTAELRTLLVRERLAGVARKLHEGWCLSGDRERRPDCHEEVVTPLGRTVFAHRGLTGQEYSFRIGETEISFHYSVFSLSTGHRVPDDDSFATEIASEGLAAFVDSFREASLEELEALPPYD